MKLVPNKPISEAEARKIVREYLHRKRNLRQIGEAHGLREERVRQVLLRRGVKRRTASEAKLMNSGGWRRLIKMKEGTTRLVSLPREMLLQAGLDPSEDLVGRWRVRGKGRILLEVREG